MRMIIDRFEGEVVLLEYEGRTYHLPKAIMPEEAREGDILTLKVSLEPVATSRQKEKIVQLIEELFED